MKPMRNILAGGATAIVVAALPPTMAAAGTTIRPDDRPTHGVGGIALEQSPAVIRPDDRASRGVTTVAVSVVRPDDRAVRGVGESVREAGAVGGSSLKSAAGFDWWAAAIGVGAGLGVALLAGGVAVAFRMRSPHPAT